MLSEQLREMLPKAGLRLAESRSANAVQITSFDALAAVAPVHGRVVALYDGRLASAHAAALRRSPPALLLACREPSGLPSDWEMNLLVALLAGGLLLPGAETFSVKKVTDIQLAANLAAERVRQVGGARAAVDIASDVMHELAANALIDAPADPDGTPKYAHRRGPDLEIAAGDGCEVALLVRDGRIYLSATDRFGRFPVSPIANAVAGLDERAKVNDAGGGAGLGLRRILEQSDVFVVRVKPGKLCQAVCAVDLGNARRRTASPKSVFFHVERG